MTLPLEFNPYRTMLDLFLLEAVESASTEILIITRNNEASLYYVKTQRMQRKLSFSHDCALHIMELVSQLKNPLPDAGPYAGRSLDLHFRLMKTGNGGCLSIMLNGHVKPETVNVVESESDKAITQPMRIPVEILAQKHE